MEPSGDQESGILSGATIAALKDYSNSGTSGAAAAAAATAPSVVPLVAYGSDDDSD
jgi:hypothetical protein